jgi:amidase
MNRRHFIKSTTLSSFVLPSVILGACERTSPSARESMVNARSKVNFELAEFTLDDLRKSLNDGKYTSRAITELYLGRIDAVDKTDVKLNSVIELNPDALTIADSLDQERREGKLRGPLHGIPVLIKDNINTADRMMTTAGSLALEGNYAAYDAFIVSKLRAAGAVILGKTNLSEWANFRSTRSSSGWSSRGGQTKNPYVLDRNPCGSSSGSGAAVSANLCAVAIGTETNGSIACPSSINGIVGIKPTIGLVSRSGIIPISHTQDTAGPMTRTVKDAAILLGIIAGADAEDTVTGESERKLPAAYTMFLDANGLEGKRIGVEKSFLKVHEAVDVLLKQALDLMKQKGAEIIEVDLLSQVKDIGGDEYKVLQYEFKDGLSRYLGNLQGPVKSLKDVIAYNKSHESRAMPFFKQEILESSEGKGSLDTPEYRNAVKKTLAISRKAIDGTMKEHKLDAICGPTNGPSWCTDLVNGDYFTGYGMYSPAAIAGYPSITVPMGMALGLPVGLTFIASAYEEPALLSIAYAYEQASLKRTPPQFQLTFSIADSLVTKKKEL